MGRETNKQRRERQATTAREKAAAARAEQRRHDQRRRAVTILSSVVAVAVVAVIIAVVAINSGGASNSASGGRTAANASVVSAVTSVAPAVYNEVGKGTIDTSALKPISDSPLTKDGKPEVLFIGGEFCPYCAAERWSLVQALSRFGDFSNLSQIRSSSTDVYPNTATFSFYKSDYTSKYLSFVGIENEDRSQNQLEPVTKEQQALWADTSRQLKGSPGFPFIYFGGKYAQITPAFSPGDLKGMTWQQIADQLKDPTSKVAQDILGEANTITAAVCQLTNGQPGSVCKASGVTAAQGALGA